MIRGSDEWLFLDRAIEKVAFTPAMESPLLFPIDSLFTKQPM